MGQTSEVLQGEMVAEITLCGLLLLGLRVGSRLAAGLGVRVRSVGLPRRFSAQPEFKAAARLS